MTVLSQKIVLKRQQFVLQYRNVESTTRTVLFTLVASIARCSPTQLPLSISISSLAAL